MLLARRAPQDDDPQADCRARKATVGQIFIDGEDVADWRRRRARVALVLQQYRSIRAIRPRESRISAEVSHPACRTAEIKERVARVARTLRIEHLLDRKD